MKTFQTIEQAAKYISSHANTGNEITLNDCLCFGMGVYAYKNECKKAGIETANDTMAFHHLNESELLTLLAWLQDNDGYLIAA